MGLFGGSSACDTDVEKATNENNTSEDWATIMEICDSIGSSKSQAKEYLKAIIKRLNAQDPHIVLQAITLLDACCSNCGKTFHLEIASRDFETELKKLLGRSQPQIVEKTKALLKKWAEGDFKSDTQLNLIPSLYNKLKQELDFNLQPESVKQSSSANAAASREEQDLARAIQLSLKENKQHSTSSSSSSSLLSHNSPVTKVTTLYPSVSAAMSAPSIPEGRKVRALYDFEAAEDNELSFSAGDIIHILDDSDASWWKGSKGKMDGLFPSNFVTADLSVEPDHITKLEQQGGKKSVQFAEEVEIKTLKREPEIIEVEIDEEKIDRLLHVLHEADPQSDVTDPPELLELEEHVMAMAPLIDAALEKVDRRHAQLTQLSSDLVDAVNLYNTLQREPPPPQSPASYNYSKIPPQMNVYPNYPNFPPHMYNTMGATHHPQYPGTFNPNLPHGLPPHTNEYMNQTITIPQHYHGPTGPHQHHPSSVHSVGPQGHPGGPQNLPAGVHPQGPPLPGHQQGPPRHPQGPPHPHSVHHPQGPPPGIPQAVHQHPQGQLPPHVTEQTSLPYQNPGFPPQNVPVPGQYVATGPQGLPGNQHSHYAPSNGQHMM